MKTKPQIFPIEFLNSLDIPGMPPHSIWLTTGSPNILLYNLNPPKLYNGTRLVIKRINGNVSKATILMGKFKGEIILLPHIPMISSDSPISLKKLKVIEITVKNRCYLPHLKNSIFICS